MVSFPRIEEVNAQSITIYIRADGSVEGTDNIQRNEIVYTFTDNIVNQSIMVERNNIVVNGVGYNLEVGYIWLENRRNVTIKNVKIRDSVEGIPLMGTCVNNKII